MSIRFQMYIPDETNEKIEWLRFKEKTSKNKIILKALDQYLKKVMEKYPEFKHVKEEGINEKSCNSESKGRSR